MVHIVADILIYLLYNALCVKRVKCAEKPQKGSHLKKKIEGLPLQKKTNILLINTQEKDEELRDFEDDESAREQRLRGNKREE